jgi:hypothetical protein
MPILRFVVLAFALGFSTAAFAQMSPEQRAARCKQVIAAQKK